MLVCSLNETEMGETCSTYGGNEKFVPYVVLEVLSKVNLRDLVVDGRLTVKKDLRGAV